MMLRVIQIMPIVELDSKIETEVNVNLH